MKKLKNLIALLLCFMSVGILASCDNSKKFKVEFSQESITLEIGEEIDLEDYVTLKYAKIENVAFSSSDNAVAYVKPNNKVEGIKNGVAIIEAKSGNSLDYLTITVSSPLESFLAVSNLSYDSDTGRVSWIPPYKVKSGITILPSSYDVKIVHNGTEEVKSTTNNYYEFSLAGEYSVSVVAKAQGYAPSASSEAVQFTVLTTPQNLAYNKETSTLTWDNTSGYEYEVFFDDYSTTVQTNSIVLPFTQAMQHKVKVRAKVGNDLSRSSNELTITRLSSPAVTISGGVLNFDVSQAALISKYIIQVENAYGDTFEVENTTGQFLLEGFVANTYYLKVFAIGGGANVLDSLNPQTYQVEKLQSPELQFDPATKTLWVSNQYASIEIVNTITQVKEVFDLENATTRILNKNNGIYEIFAYNKPMQNNQIKSDNSNYVNVKILSNITQLKHLASDNVSTVSFVGVEGAEGYNILINNASESFTLREVANLLVLTMTKPTDELFAQSGTYTLAVEAYDTVFESQIADNHEFYLIRNNSANDTINIVRLDKVSATENNKIISWDTFDNADGYSYKLYKNDVFVLENSTTFNMFDISDQTFGNYKFEIIAFGNRQTVLDSLEISTVEFQIKETLQTPSLAFDRQTGELVVGQVDNADEYVVSFQDMPLATLTDNLRLFIGDLFVDAGEYNFSVVAKSLTNSADDDGEGNLFSSVKADLQIEKLPALTRIDIENKNIAFDISSEVAQVLSATIAQVIYNGTEITSLSQIENFEYLSNFTLNIKLLANTNLVNPYYLDSNFAEFNFERVATPTSLEFEDGVVSWNASSTPNYKLILSVSGSNYEFSLNENFKDIEDFEPESFYQDMLTYGFSFAVRVQIDNLTALCSTEESTITNYISSVNSEFCQILVLQTPEITGVTFDDDVTQKFVTVTWNEVENAQNYVVTYQDVDYIINAAETSYTFETNSTQNTYTFAVKAISYNHLQSKTASLNFERIAAPSIINIDNNENVSLSVRPLETKEIFFNGLVHQNNVFSLSSIVESDELEIRFEATGLNGNTYYLNSNPTIYNFERLATLQNVEIVDDKIVWEIEPLADEYEITLTNFQGINKIIKMNAKIGVSNYIFSLPLIDSQILNFASESGIYQVRVRSIVLAYSLDSNNVNGHLSSLKSDPVPFTKLAEVSSISVLADDSDEQIGVTINFNAVAGATNYDVYLNDRYFQTTYTNSLYTEDLTYESEFGNAGVFAIRIIARANNFISSNFSSAYTVRRLPTVNQNSLTITDSSRFSWIGVSNNSGYKVYYRRSGESASDVYYAPTVYYDFDSLLTEDEFSGYIDFFVLVNGNGTTTLSSKFVYSSKVRIDKPEFEIFGSHLIISESTLWQTAKYNVSVKFDNGTDVLVLRSFEWDANERFDFPDVWTYQNNPITQDGEYIFEVYAFATNAIFSPKAEARRHKLQSISILGFAKLSGTEQQIVLKADASALSAVNNVTYKLIVDANGYEYTQSSPDANSILTYTIANELDYHINSGNFKLKLKATKDGYLDSSSASISGYRLSPVTRLDGSGGILNWSLNNHTLVSGYLLRVLHSESVYERRVKANNVSSDSLEGISGSIVANIKVLGNLQVGEPVTSGVVLDSTYMLNAISPEDVQEKNFTTSKLAVPDSFDMLFGQFKIKIVDDATGYDVRDQFGRIFTLQTSVYEDDFAVGLSSEFYTGAKKLSLNTTYTMNVRAISDVENVLYSDFSSSSKDIRLMPNPNTQQSDLTFTWSTTHVNSISITWQSSSISPNYVYELVCNSTQGNNVVRRSYYDSVLGQNSVTLNMDDYPLSGNYYFRIAVLGKLLPELGGYYYITSDFSPALEFVKLSDPVVEVEDGRLVWNTVSGANGYYIYYTVKDVNEMVLDSFITLYTEYPQMQNQIYWNAPTSFGRLDQSLTYYFGVRAINTINEMKLAPSSIGAVYQYDPVEEGTADIEYLDTLRPVTKLEAPNQLQLIDGTLKWREGGLDYNINLLGMTLNAGDKPFTYSAGVEKLADLSIVIKLEDINGTQRKYVVPAIKFFHAAIADGPIFSYVAEMLNLPENFEFGWPVLQWFTSELGSTVVPGVQSLSVSQKGNDYDWLDSNYTSSYDVYIAHAPATRISNYVLSWDAVSLPVTEYPYGATNKYTVVAENESGIRKYIHSTNNLSIDLRDLVNADILGSGRHKIYVMVTGDSSTYLYGLPSTPIEVLVLPNVNASIIGGVLDWASLSQAVTYNVIMDPNNINYRFESLMNAGPWDFKEIAVKNAVGEVLVYNLTIQAIGNGNNIISGKVTNMGQIIKLETPNMSVSQSVLVWPNILANEGYEIIIRRDGALLDSAYLPKDRTFYESKTSGFNNYNLRAVGTTSGSLNESSQSYAISSESAYGVYAVMLNSVTTARAHEGQLLWSNIKELNNVPVVGYKITFDDSHHKLPVYVTQFTPIILTGESYVLYTIDSNYSAGEYKLYIQPYSLNTYLREEDGKTYHYLLGGIVEQSSVEFIKLQNTLEIYAQDGVIMWTDNEPLSNTYKVVFTRETSQGTQTVTFYTNTNTFNPSALSKEDEQRYKDLIVGEQYSVKVQTLGDNVDLINSDETKRDGYTKLSTISTVEYDNDETGQEGFIIRWIFTNYVSEVTNYQYIIRYVNNATAEEFTLDSRESSAIKIGVDTLGRYYGQIDASLLMTENTQQLSFSIQVVPVETTALVLISDYSQVRSVTPPASLSGIFTYVAESRKIAWQYSAGGTDVSFRIIDEIVELDENNQVVGEALETRIYVSQVSEFYPELTGLHRIRVQVILTGAQVASPYVYFNYQMAQEGIINHDYLDEESPYTIVNFNLFDGGDGSQSNPYTITTQTQFENINQRLTKPSYMGGGRFYFKQNQNLTMTLANPIGAFAGVYDGNGKQLTWQISNLSAQKVALFISLEPNAEIKNVIVNAHIIQLEDSILPEVYLSALVSDNYGTIQNSQVKSINFETAVTRGIRYYFGSFASVNYGAITLCVNSANINFDIRNGIVHIGGIAYMNSSTTRGGISYIGTISQTGNTGNITVYASRFRIGGLVETTNIDSTIMQSYNKGDITTTLTTGTQENYIGGLVAYNRGEIRNSYNIANALSANMSSYTRTIYIGGLSGFIEGQKGARISNCFTTTTNITTTNSSQATKYLASMVGLSGANSTTLQTTSYYTYSSNLSAINSPPSGFNFAQIGTYSALLTLLNNADYVFEQQNPSYPPRLRWEANFTIN